jgi:large subunit ribosomal protein L3
LEDHPVALQLLCRKLGMTQLYAADGECIPVTVLHVEPNPIIQKKTVEKDGYSALQLGIGARRAGRTNKALAGHFKKANVAPTQRLIECRVTPEVAAQHEVGGTIGASLFEQGQRVDLIGTSKGRGTSGVVRRHHFAIKRQTHGTHEYFRHGGAIGTRSFPGHVIKGLGMAGRMGNERSTALNREVVRVDAEKGLIFVRGGVPGHKEGILRVRATVKGKKKARSN